MTRAEVERVARRFIQVWSPRGAQVIDELAAPDIVVSYSHFPAPVRGAGTYKAVIAETLEYFPDLQTVAEEVLVDRDRAAVRWSYTGTHERGGLYGLEATGRRVKVKGFSVLRVRDGRVVEETGVADTFGLMTQLGAVPAPGPEE